MQAPPISRSIFSSPKFSGFSHRQKPKSSAFRSLAPPCNDLTLTMHKMTYICWECLTERGEVRLAILRWSSHVFGENDFFGSQDKLVGMAEGKLKAILPYILEFSTPKAWDPKVPHCGLAPYSPRRARASLSAMAFRRRLAFTGLPLASGIQPTAMPASLTVCPSASRVTNSRS